MSNNGEAIVKGVEGQLSHKFEDGLPITIGGTLTYLENDTSTIEEKTLYSRYFGSAYAVFEWTKWKLGLAYYGSRNLAYNSYDRMDANVIHTVRLNGQAEIEVGLNYRHYPHDQAVLSEYSSTDPYYFSYRDQDRLSGTIKLRF